MVDLSGWSCLQMNVYSAILRSWSVFRRVFKVKSSINPNLQFLHEGTGWVHKCLSKLAVSEEKLGQKPRGNELKMACVNSVIYFVITQS